MGTIQAQTILNRASIQLLDEENVRWPLDELLQYLNEGQRVIVMHRPEAGATVEPVQLVAGTKQTLPVGAQTLLEVSRNLGTDGLTPGRAIRVVSGEVLGAVDPDWHTGPAASVVKNYVYDPRNPTVFFVTPPQPTTGQGYVELVTAKNPPEVALADPIALDDVYGSSLLDYVLYRAYGKDSEFGAELNLAAQHYTTFLQSLGILTKEQLLRSPNLMPLPMNPQIPAAAR